MNNVSVLQLYGLSVDTFFFNVSENFPNFESDYSIGDRRAFLVVVRCLTASFDFRNNRS